MDVFLDASALVAIVTGEPERDDMLACAMDAGRRFTSPVALFEAEAATTRKPGGDHVEAERRLNELPIEFDLLLLPLDAETGRLAREVRRRDGRGMGHPARLNMGDCFAYACARQHGLTLLFKGEDFVHTDVTPAMQSTDQGSS